MKILVRHNNPVKAFKVLTRKLREEGVFNELRNKQFFKSKGELRREEKKKGALRAKKREKERQLLFEQTENRPKRGNNGQFRNKSRN